MKSFYVPAIVPPPTLPHSVYLYCTCKRPHANCNRDLGVKMRWARVSHAHFNARRFSRKRSDWPTARVPPAHNPLPPPPPKKRWKYVIIFCPWLYICQLCCSRVDLTIQLWSPCPITTDTWIQMAGYQSLFRVVNLWLSNQSQTRFNPL